MGKGVSELAAAFSQLIEMGALLEDVGHTIHAQPRARIDAWQSSLADAAGGPTDGSPNDVGAPRRSV